MSIKVMSHVWEQSEQKGSALLLLIAIADNANDDGVCWPSIGFLADKIRMSERNTQYLLKSLVASGELEITPNAGSRGCNLFRVQTLRGGAITIAPGGCNPASKGGAIAIAPEPSLEPSENRKKKSESSSSENFDDFSDSQIKESNPTPPTSKQDFGTLGNLAAAAPLEVSPPPVAETPREYSPSPNPHAPFIEGDDPRFHTPHFREVCLACGYDPDDLTFQKRAKIVIQTDRLLKYTPGQIREAAAAWPHPKHPHPQQFADEINRLLSQKEITNHAKSKRNASAAALAGADARRAERAAKLAELDAQIAAENGVSASPGRNH